MVNAKFHTGIRSKEQKQQCKYQLLCLFKCCIASQQPWLVLQGKNHIILCSIRFTKSDGSALPFFFGIIGRYRAEWKKIFHREQLCIGRELNRTRFRWRRWAGQIRNYRTFRNRPRLGCYKNRDRTNLGFEGTGWEWAGMREPRGYILYIKDQCMVVFLLERKFWSGIWDINLRFL